MTQYNICACCSRPHHPLSAHRGRLTILTPSTQTTPPTLHTTHPPPPTRPRSAPPASPASSSPSPASSATPTCRWARRPTTRGCTHCRPTCGTWRRWGRRWGGSGAWRRCRCETRAHVCVLDGGSNDGFFGGGVALEFRGSAWLVCEVL